ncbi:MAG: hypothetical protein M3Y27_05865 [Acidobacteriota bacterium]|nr:hypothetical protein [Acidobacteriota bacterium]
MCSTWVFRQKSSGTCDLGLDRSGYTRKLAPGEATGIGFVEITALVTTKGLRRHNGKLAPFIPVKRRSRKANERVVGILDLVPKRRARHLAPGNPAKTNPATYEAARTWHAGKGQQNGSNQEGLPGTHMLHTHDPKEADTEEFAHTLRDAKGVWFNGGRQWNCVDSYMNTLTYREFHNVLAPDGLAVQE